MSAAERKAAPEEGWESLTVDELREELESRGLKKSGTKDELVARLTEDDEAGAAPEEEPEEQPARPRGSAETITEEKKAAPTRPDGAVIVSASAKYVRSASTSLPDFPITIPGRAVWMLTSTSVLFFLIVMLDRPAWASLFSMCSRILMSSSR